MNTKATNADVDWRSTTIRDGGGPGPRRATLLIAPSILRNPLPMARGAERDGCALLGIATLFLALAVLAAQVLPTSQTPLEFLGP